MLDTLLNLALANGVLALALMLAMRRDYARLGRISPLVAFWSGIVMHGHGILTFAVAWVDRSSASASSPMTIYMGAALAALGAAIIFAGRFAYGSRPRVYGLKEDKLIKHGIYRRIRNPQYFGYWKMFLGAALAALSGWAFLLAMVFALFMHFHITRIEEPHLKRVFGEAYEDYCATVARYFWRSRRAT